MRNFEKVSIDEFSKYYDKSLYEEYLLPRRMTAHSAGYDFFAIEGFTIKPGEIKKIPTAIKAEMNHDEVLMIYIRSSLGFKYNLRLCNQVGIIDSDYYNNIDNEGHIFIAIQNEGKETITLKTNDRFAQGLFIKYLTVDDEKEIKNARTGGIGSTRR